MENNNSKTNSKTNSKIIITTCGKRRRVQLNCSEKTRTKQQFTDECNINTIVKRNTLSGIIQQGAEALKEYGDATTVPDFQTSQNIVIRAQAMFDSLPSDIRRRFNNEPVEFLEFAENSENAEQMIDLGLKEKPAPEESASGMQSPEDGVADPSGETSESASEKKSEEVSE